MTVKRSCFYNLELTTKSESIGSTDEYRLLLASLTQLENYLGEFASRRKTPDGHTFKNLGVGYAKLVRSEIQPPVDVPWPIPHTSANVEAKKHMVEHRSTK
eukprot:gb/GECG01015372.1/.p1 GENE.gb/GECG01015372.1/~~gb/GECG01015372.1/.p1  ORF type:complete len:101 (+),score=8.55 gb/GECG01015372.1/:1-303(+)